MIALRSIANLATSVPFWMVPWFAGTAFLGVMMGLARAIDEIGFKGVIAAEVQGGDADYLRETVVKRMDAIFALG